MVSMDIFRQDPFSTFQMTSALERLPYEPDGLGALNIFTPNPIRTTALGVEERDGVLGVIQTSERGTPIASERTTEKRKVRYFETGRITQGDTLWASEIQNIREFGQESELVQVMTEVARRLSGPTGLMANVRYTWESMRLGAVQGLLIDADGSAIFNYFDEFQIAAPTEVAFDLASKTAGSLRPKVNAIVRTMARAAKGAMTAQSGVVALCGDAFYDLLVTHPDVEKTYLNWAAAQDLRDGSQGAAFKGFDFAGVTWLNYRGSDDNTTIKIADDKVKFFPVNAPGVFEVAWAPGETFEWANTPGKEAYVIPIVDKDRNMWWRQEVYSYPLFMCKRPEVLATGRSES